MLHSVMRASHARSRTIPITYPSFSTTFGGLGTLEAQLDPPQTIVLYTARLAFYTGPAIEQMPSLTDAQRASIIAALPVPQAAG